MEKLINFLSSMRWQDFIDISLNSYILFRFYVLFRGTNVFRVLIGMTVLWFFQRIAISVGLIVTSWVVQGIVAVGAIIIIVVFRNEIRRVLQAKNLKSILWGLSSKSAIAPTEIIVDSVFEMAHRKCGCLIVFPGKEDLSDAVQGGIPWKGLITREMIASIFWPDNPVHDGAAIVNGDQISVVGAILPLSQRDDLPSRYGTRHRAALGLAEATDALVIVVSEERGDVLVAKGSHLREVKQKGTLESNLQEHLGSPAIKKRYLRKERLETVTAALLSIIFITGIWFSVSRGQTTLVSLDIPIEYLNQKPGTEIVDTSVKSVNLVLSGSGALIKSITPDQVSVRLDLSQAVVGPNTVTVTAGNISLPPGILLKEINPPAVEVDLDETIKKTLPVQIDWTGKLPPQLILVNCKIDPKTVEVVGGKRFLDKMTTLYTEKVPLDNLRGQGEITAKLALNPASLKIAPGSKDKVTIDYLIRKRE
ncbi:MAG: diadenylate cyclase [Desulfobacterales bacterium]|jgi:diadenylate cyclase